MGQVAAGAAAAASPPPRRPPCISNFADQEAARPDRREPVEIGRRRRCRSRPTISAVRAAPAAPAPRWCARSTFRVFRLRLLMPTSRQSSRKRAVELGAVVHFHQHVHAQLGRERGQLARLAVVERRHDQQDAIGAQRPALDHLVGVEDEVLAQYRQLAGGARRPQIVVAALEIRRVGQYRQAGRAAGLIGAGEGRRVEIGADQASARAGLLDLGDQAETGRPRSGLPAPPRTAAPAAPRPASPAAPPPAAAALRRATCSRLTAQISASTSAMAGPSFVAATSRSSTWRAAPPSIDCGRQLGALAQALGPAGDDQRRGAVEQHDVAQGTGAPASSSRISAGVVRRLAALQRRRCTRGCRPASSGTTSNSTTLPFLYSATLLAPQVVNSSMPCAMHDPGALGAEPAQHLGHRPHPFRREHADQLPLVPAGFDSGPSRLKIVRVPSSTRVGATWRMAL